ncbi:MAG: glycosyltransferase family 39 protein [bacterium]
MKRTFWIYIIPLLLLFAVTLPHLEQGDFRVETAHYGAVGLQAWQNPSLFWTLHEHPSVPYFNKPPLVFWIHGLFLHLLGISLATARIPSILAAAGCVLLTVFMTRRFMGRATALAAGSILALSYEFFRRTREISLDMWQLFFMLAAVALWITATHTRRRHYAWLAGIPLGLALLCKPLMAFLVPCIFIGWYFAEPSFKFLRIRDFFGFLMVTLAIALPWHLSMVFLHGEAFTNQYFGHEVIKRMQGHQNDQPLWYYPIEMGKTYWPWMLLLVCGGIRWTRGSVSRHHRQALTLALIWLVIWTVALNLFPDKRPRYALPLYPMLAILSGYGLVTLPWRNLRRLSRNKLGLTGVVIMIVAFTISVLPIRFQAPPEPALSALVEWAGGQNPATVYSAALSSVDESMLYLKAGYWPTPLSPRAHPPAGSLLIYTDTMTPKPAPSENSVFQRGPYRVILK